MSLDPDKPDPAARPVHAKPARKRAARRDLLLEEAARQINAVGAGAIVLNDIAEKVGLSRNALYYYVADRADLVFRAYQRACETMTDDLVAAEEQGADPAARLTLFIESQLAFDRPAQTVLSDIDFLPEPQRGLIRDQHQRNVAALRAQIARGVSEGVFRPCDTEIAAQSLIGMISWARLSADWLGYRDGRAARRRMITATIDLALHGFAADDRRPAGSLCDIDVEALTAKPFNAFDRRQTNEIKITQLIAAASRLFNRRGIDGASLDEISAMVGATKGAVYHYFDDKADLVVRCYRRAFELYDVFMDTATARGRDGFEKAILCLHLNVQAQAGPLSPLMPQPGRLTLPEPDRSTFSRASLRLRRVSARSLRQGVADGSVRACDTAFAGEVAAGIFLWLPKWLPDAYPLTPRQIADETADLFAYGLVARP
ncbi:TetR family transcriptional regulator [Phenylobacterium aquaticum]|uniref:TetR family transcriptional regulator n=1 Tax=Phenylobacterium aquaticum TaxID=1763816 RepID=UPI001F5CF859|nr:TetR family transcriptional regulator [Phenylobacterium aquaticum]MCI3134338.1 TetR family transcriptional regulator [Phenylobacterium aquaticum]